MKIGSLFSGIGGIEIGFEAEGFETSWFVEKDEYARAILRKRFATTPIYGDVTKLDFNTVSKVDIITGGFPCQDISNAGKRVGITGDRSSLWKYYAEAIRILRPKYAVIENVAALTQRGLDVVLADLAKIGYDAEWYNISASTVGAPHRRERIFIIAYSSNTRHERIRGEQCEKGISKENNEVSNSNSGGHVHGEPQINSTERRQYAQRESISDSSMENPISNRNDEGNRKKNSRRKESSKHSNLLKRTGGWSVEPRLDRVAHGVPNRIHRIKCLGNAVVPPVAQIFAQAIKEYEVVKC